MSKESQEVKFSGFLPSLPKEKLLQNFEEAKQKIDVESEDHKEIWEEFSKAVTGCICEIVFSPKISNKEDSDKASALLKNYRDDALLINPKFFNKWIYDFRKRFSSLLDFWKNEMVAKELGPLWTGDFELFDRFDDPEPGKFYQLAVCESPCLEEVVSAVSTASLKKISLDNTLADYKDNMKAQKDIDINDEDAFTKIFTEVREVLWKLIFDEPALSETKAKQAAELLWAYKVDACFRSPYQYNDWIVTVRDELVKRKFVDFWKIVVDQELGLIGSKESDYFDDMDDPEIPEFYKIGNDNLKMESK
uniref:Ku C-terminal domain-containing protein n=1 Tax=Musca domestica TaxID=7370 RepID=A0A1I8MVR7_MUSDO